MLPAMSRLCPTQPHCNLGAHSRSVSLRVGVLGLGFALALGLVLVELGAASQLGWLLALPLGFGSYWLLAGLFGVCAVSSLRGQRRADYGTEFISDHAARRGFMFRGLSLVAVSMTLGALGTGVFLISV